jgi:hypothetical protein
MVHLISIFSMLVHIGYISGYSGDHSQETLPFKLCHGNKDIVHLPGECVILHVTHVTELSDNHME